MTSSRERKRNVFGQQFCQRGSQVGVALNAFAKEISEAKKLLNLIQVRSLRPVSDRLNLLGINFYAILAHKVWQFSFAPCTFRHLDENRLLLQCGHNSLDMLYMLLSRSAEDQYVINEDKNKVRHSRQGVDATVSKVLGVLKDPVCNGRRYNDRTC